MNWYIFYLKQGSTNQLLERLNKQEDLYAFIPQIEKWFKCSEFSTYQLKEMYPGYVFIKTSLNKEEFEMKYSDFFHTIFRLGELIKQDSFIDLKEDEKEMLSLLFHDSNVIKHSVGSYFGDILNISEGPLCGFESKIKKINRHKHTAILDCKLLGMNMVLPIEVINSKGSV